MFLVRDGEKKAGLALDSTVRKRESGAPLTFAKRAFFFKKKY